MNTNVSLDSRQNKISDESRRTELLAAYKVSGLTQREYARREGINYNTFGAWLWQQGQGESSLAEHSLPRGTSTHLEVTLPGQIVVRGDDAAAVASLVQSLML